MANGSLIADLLDADGDRSAVMCDLQHKSSFLDHIRRHAL
jgi:hypothetical protein